jgi:hypothetical protein
MKTIIDLEILGSTILFGIAISHFETKTEDGEWNPAFEISIGFIFFRIILSRYKL